MPNAIYVTSLLNQAPTTNQQTFQHFSASSTLFGTDLGAILLKHSGHSDVLVQLRHEGTRRLSNLEVPPTLDPEIVRACHHEGRSSALASVRRSRDQGAEVF